MDGGKLTGAYSLWEMLVTVAVAATVIAIGVPSFTGMTADSRLRAQTNALFHAVHLARKESVVRRRAVTLCPTADGERCGALDDWSSGWMMFVNLNRDQPAERDDNEPLLQYFEVDNRVRITANRRSFSFRTTELRATNGTLILCDRAGHAAARDP